METVIYEINGSSISIKLKTKGTQYSLSKEEAACMLSSLAPVAGETTPRVVGYLAKVLEMELKVHSKVSQGKALRFIGEMIIAKHLKVAKSRREYDDWLDNRILLSNKLSKLIAQDESQKVTEPVSRFKGQPNVAVRRGANSRSKIKQDNQSYRVSHDIRKTRFNVNEFMLEVIQEFKPDTDDKSADLMLGRAIMYAKKYKTEMPEFMFNHFLDCRGREYDMNTTGLSPTGADWSKSLIVPVFAEPLNSTGYKALIEAINGYSEQDWSVETMINHARNWRTTSEEWLTADKPYMYLASAEFLMRYHDDPSQPLPSYTPLDARCSALQHWSALSKSSAITSRLGMEIDPPKDNLDLYEYIAEVWSKKLDPEHLQYAVRKIAKVPAMTYCYNATVMTSIRAMKKMLGSKVEWDGLDDDGTHKWKTVEEGLDDKTCAMLGASLYGGLLEALGGIRPFTEWLGRCAYIIGMENREILWTTHDGFVAKQKKTVREEYFVSVGLSDDSVMQVQMTRDTKKPNARKHKSALAPDLIHSFDATHLRMVARRLVDLGLEPIFVHDSFSVHSNYRDVLYDIIVDEFIKMYSGDTLGKLRQEWIDLYEVELPELPEYGDWDVNILRDCREFFS